MLKECDRVADEDDAVVFLRINAAGIRSAGRGGGEAAVPVDLAVWEPGNRSVPGVLVHAQILRSMLNGGLVGQVAPWVVVLLVLTGATFWLVPSTMPTRVILLVFLVTLPIAAFLSLKQGVFVPMAGPMLAAVLGAGSRYVMGATDQARERALLRHSFGSYVSPQIMAEILAGNLHPGSGGQKRTVAILFSDIRDFTRRSEYMSPEDLIAMLNQYFTEMTMIGS